MSQHPAKRKVSFLKLFLFLVSAFAAAGGSMLIYANSRSLKQPYYKCVDGVKYEVRNGNELYIQKLEEEAIHCL